MEKFQLSKFTKEGEELLRGVKEEFKRLGIDASRKIFPTTTAKSNWFSSGSSARASRA